MIGRALGAVSAAMILLAAPAAAQDAGISTKVKIADLDLQTELGQARLERRLRQAAYTICGGSPGGLRADEAFAECRQDVMLDADEKIAALTTTKARNIQVARRTR